MPPAPQVSGAAADRSSFDEAAQVQFAHRPLSEVVVVEMFCGSGRLGASLRMEGFDAFGIDHIVSKQAACSVLQLDFCEPESVKHFWELISDPSVGYVHCAPPCGTASRKAFWLKVPNLGRGGFGTISVLFYRLERHGSLDLSFDRRATGTRRCSDRDGDSP